MDFFRQNFDSSALPRNLTSDNRNFQVMQKNRTIIEVLTQILHIYYEFKVRSSNSQRLLLDRTLYELQGATFTQHRIKHYGRGTNLATADKLKYNHGLNFRESRRSHKLPYSGKNLTDSPRRHFATLKNYLLVLRLV